VLAHHHQVVAGAESVVGRREQLGPDRHREQAAGEEVDDHAEQVLDADDLVVEGVPEVLDQAARGRMLDVVQRLAEDHPPQVVEHPEPGQPADGAERVPEHDRDVVGVRQRVLRVAAGQEVPQPVAEKVTPHAQDDAGVEGRPHPPGPPHSAIARAVRLDSLRTWLSLNSHPAYLFFSVIRVVTRKACPGSPAGASTG
jgi:hypothetical protein